MQGKLPCEIEIYMSYRYQMAASATGSSGGVERDGNTGGCSMKEELAYLRRQLEERTSQFIPALQKSRISFINLFKHLLHSVLLRSLVHCTNPYTKPFPFSNARLPALNNLSLFKASSTSSVIRSSIPNLASAGEL